MNGNIYIAEPCHENWNKMSPAEKGRHCDVCSKVVTDFTKMEKEEVAKTLATSGDDVCGHINLNHLTPANNKQKMYFWFKGTFIPKLGYVAFTIFGLAAIFKKSAFAQNLDGKVVMMNGGAKYQEPIADQKKVNVVVVDEHNRPVPDALVKITINDAVVASAATSEKGECSNMIESTGNTLINIEVDAYGYKHKIVKQIRVGKTNQTYRVKLDEEVIFMGKMMVTEILSFETVIDSSDVPVKCNSQPEVSITHPTVVLVNPFPEKYEIEKQDLDLTNDSVGSDKHVPLFQLESNPLSFIAFPNPTMADLTIQTKEDVSFDIKIFSESGALVLQVPNQYQRAQISLEGNAAGNYFAMIFINNKAIETHKIILIR
jgi:hypothetical protein